MCTAAWPISWPWHTGTAQPTAGLLGRIWRSVGHIRETDSEAIQHHYDVSNAFYVPWLNEHMVYSCGYFEQGGETLDVAQLNKIDHILWKIRLQPGQRLLNMGCGWGALRGCDAVKQTA